MRSSPLVRMVLVLLAVTAALTGWVGVHTVMASRDLSVRGELDYQTFLEALDDLIREAGDSTLLVFHDVEEEISPNRTVAFDTIAITADAWAFPSFARAGFLYDQVQIYNRFQRERLALARVAPEWFDRLKPYNPSVFRRSQGLGRDRELTRASSAWSLRVRSPLEGEWSGEILAQDVHRGQGLLGPRVAVPLRRPVRLVREVEGRRQLCEFVPYTMDVRAFCLSEERIPQATFRLASDERSQGWAVAGWDDLWVDGLRVRAGDSVGIPDGTLLRLNPLEPVVFGEFWEGVLSSRQWVNGRMRRRTELPQPLDLLAALGRGPSPGGAAVSPSASLHLSIRAEASAALTQELQEFLDQELDVPLDFGMVILARVPDGEIVALAEVGERRNLGRSSLLERVAPGSAVKPLLAAAILSERPELASLRIPARSGSVRSVLGLPPVGARRAFTTALNCAPPGSGRVDLRYFLRCSNNEYAASLVVSGLESVEDGDSGTRPGNKPRIPLENGRVPRATLLRSPLAQGLNRLYGLAADPAIADSAGRTRRAWTGLTYSDGTPASVPFELLPAESRPALLAPGSSEGTELGLLYRYAYGAWENQWTLLDLTRGFARVVSDQPLELRFFPGSDETGTEEGTAAAEDGGDASPSAPASLGLAQQDWYPAFLEGLRGVAEDGTASGLRRGWALDGLPSTVFAKTGTLNEAGEPGPLDDLFAKSLLFAVGRTTGEIATEDGSAVTGAASEALGCGMVGGIYLRFSEGPRRGSLPSYQVEFARRKLGEFLQAHWEEFGGCN